MLLDVRMPGLNGAEMFARLRRINPALPIVFVTGYSDSDAVHSLVKNGEAKYLAKPFGSDELIDILKLTQGSA